MNHILLFSRPWLPLSCRCCWDRWRGETLSNPFTPFFFVCVAKALTAGAITSAQWSGLTHILLLTNATGISCCERNFLFQGWTRKFKLYSHVSVFSLFLSFAICRSSWRASRAASNKWAMEISSCRGGFYTRTRTMNNSETDWAFCLLQIRSNLCCSISVHPDCPCVCSLTLQ